MLNNLQKIVIEKPVDQIIEQIRFLITSGELKPGDKLPPERKLADHLGVGRGPVRDAIRKLEFYGILKTLPQSGTVVAGMGLKALEGLITDVLKLETADFASLVETRVILETNAAHFAAKRRTEDDIVAITNALNDYEAKISEGAPAVEEDLLFHLKIAEASKNRALKSFMLIITPDIVKNFIELRVCDDGRFQKTVEEHQVILDYIIEKNSKGASEAMRAHLSEVLAFSSTIDSLNN
jgi:GntR family transcriptional repressor for pyruvate dehydrogenase complex